MLPRSILFVSLTLLRNLFCSACDNYKKYDVNSTLARCLDGTQGAFYISNGFDDGKDKWIIYFEGGGWCSTIKECLNRSFTALGSSNSYPECVDNVEARNDFLKKLEEPNPLFYNWNKVHVKYCDGGSYSGNGEVFHEVLNFILIG